MHNGMRFSNEGYSAEKYRSSDVRKLLGEKRSFCVNNNIGTRKNSSCALGRIILRMQKNTTILYRWSRERERVVVSVFGFFRFCVNYQNSQARLDTI